ASRPPMLPPRTTAAPAVWPRSAVDMERPPPADRGSARKWPCSWYFCTQRLSGLRLLAARPPIAQRRPRRLGEADVDARLRVAGQRRQRLQLLQPQQRRVLGVRGGVVAAQPERLHLGGGTDPGRVRVRLGATPHRLGPGLGGDTVVLGPGTRL